MNPFKLVTSRKVYKNPWIEVQEDVVIRPGGKEGIFGIVEMKDGCTILAIDEINNILITKEYHYTMRDSSIELISGGIDGNETPIECAKRELKEEAGITADEWLYLGYIDPFTTVIRSRNHLFLAKKLRATMPQADEGEIVNLEKISYKEAFQKVIDSKISHGASVVCILKSKKYIK